MQRTLVLLIIVGVATMAEGYGGEYVTEHFSPGACCASHSTTGDSWTREPVVKQPACAGPDALALHQTWWVWFQGTPTLQQYRITHLTQRVIAISYQGPLPTRLSPAAERRRRTPKTYPLDAALQYGRICFVEEIPTED